MAKSASVNNIKLQLIAPDYGSRFSKLNRNKTTSYSSSIRILHRAYMLWYQELHYNIEFESATHCAVHARDSAMQMCV